MGLTMSKTYTDLIKLSTFADRFHYLSIGGEVGRETFGFERYLNQRFYHSREWKLIRDHVIARDYGCDMALPNHEISGRIIIHHMNPILSTDIIHGTEFLMDPEFLVCVSHNTHNAIHYGDESLLTLEFTERQVNDTCPWRR